VDLATATNSPRPKTRGQASAAEQRRVRTASGSDRIVRATQPEPLFRKFLFDPVATARGSDRMLLDGPS